MNADWEDPLKDLKLMQERMNSLLEESLLQSPAEAEELVEGRWEPVADAFETESEFVLLVETTGIVRDQIELRVDGSRLTIGGDRQPSDVVSGAQPLWLERAYGPFSRSFDIPPQVDEQRISATQRDGVLIIRMPKRSAERGGQFQISVE